MKAVGLDIGTTSICGVRICCETGAIEKTVVQANDTWIAGKHSWEKIQNPDRICEKAEEMLKALLDEDTAAVGVTGQMHGILYTDGDGRAVSPLYTWQDGRGNLPRHDKTYAGFLNSYSGYGNVTHFYQRENGLIPGNAEKFCTIHDYLVMRLTGRREPLVHSSDAASFGLYDLKTNRFITEDPFHPQVTCKLMPAGEWRHRPVSVAVGDNQAGFFGCGCDSHTLLVNVGTGSQISMMTDQAEAGQGMEIRPLYDDKMIAVGSSLCGGRAYAILEKFFREAALMAGVSKDSMYDAMLDEAKKSPETGVKFSTLFCGTRNEPGRRAVISGLSEDNFTPGSLIRGCMEGIASELWELYRSFGIPCTRLVASGNGVRKNPELRKVIEKTFGMRLSMPRYAEEAAAGAALSGLTAAGVFKNMEEAERMVAYDL